MLVGPQNSRDVLVGVTDEEDVVASVVSRQKAVGFQGGLSYERPITSEVIIRYNDDGVQPTERYRTFRVNRVILQNTSFPTETPLNGGAFSEKHYSGKRRALNVRYPKM